MVIYPAASLIELQQLPQPIRGFLTTSALLNGPLTSPTAVVDVFSLTDASLAEQDLPDIEGRFRFANKTLTFDEMRAIEGDTNASVTGAVTLAGPVSLDIDIHNLGAEVLSPWVQDVSRLGGSADIYLRVRGVTDAPDIRGNMEVFDPVIGAVRLERLRIDNFWVENNQLIVEDINIVKGPHSARASATIPLNVDQTAGSAPIRAEFALENQNIAFLSALFPTFGEFSGQDNSLNAALQIGGTIDQPILESGFIQAAGNWKKGDQQARIDLNSRVMSNALHLVTPENTPGLLISTERVQDGQTVTSGTVTVTGEYDPFAGTRERWGYGRYNFAVSSRNFRAKISDVVTARANADLVLRGEPGQAAPDHISGTVEILQADATPPPTGIGGALSWQPKFSPTLDVLLIARNVDVTADTARVSFSGRARLGGRLGYEPLAITHANPRVAGGAIFRGDEGRLDFPGATAEISNVQLLVAKQPYEPLRASITQLEAGTRIGRYRVTLTGSGQVYPTMEFQIRSTSTPPLSDAQVAALLLGVPPSVASTLGLTPEEALGRQVSESLTGAATAVAIAGLSTRLSRIIGLSELSFELGPVGNRVQVGKQITDRLYISYLAPIGGAQQRTTDNLEGSALLRLSYDITPLFSVGFSVNDLDQLRYEIQSSRSF